jgi:hypothetical protein
MTVRPPAIPRRNSHFAHTTVVGLYAVYHRRRRCRHRRRHHHHNVAAME